MMEMYLFGFYLVKDILLISVCFDVYKHDGRWFLNLFLEYLFFFRLAEKDESGRLCGISVWHDCLKQCFYILETFCL